MLILQHFHSDDENLPSVTSVQQKIQAMLTLVPQSILRMVESGLENEQETPWEILEHAEEMAQSHLQQSPDDAFWTALLDEVERRKRAEG